MYSVHNRDHTCTTIPKLTGITGRMVENEHSCVLLICKETGGDMYIYNVL